MENQLSQGLVYRHIRADQCDIPIPAAIYRQLHNLPCRSHAFLIRGFRTVRLQVTLCGTLCDRSLEKFFPHDIQRRHMFRDDLHLNFHSRPAGTLVYFLCRRAGFLKGQQRRIHLITVQAHGYTGRNLDQVLDDGKILPGEVRESVYVKDMFFAKGSFFQMFQQPCHLVSGVPLTPAAQAVIALHQESQFFQLLRKAAFRFFRGTFQVL